MASPQLPMVLATFFLQFLPGVACTRACDAFGDAQYCCSGEFASPDTWKPNTYSEFFKNACPQAYSYAYDDGTSTFICAGAVYIITFCPGPSTRLNLVANPARPNPQGSFHYGTVPIVKIPVLENTAPKTKPYTYKNAPAETKSCSTASTSSTSDVHFSPRNPRRLLGKQPDVNVPSPPSTSNEKSRNLDKVDPQSPPAPTGNRPIHE